MGDIADGLVDGTFDSVTGEYLGKGPGYPRTFEKGKVRPYITSKKVGKMTNCKKLNGIMKFFNGYGYFRKEKEAYEFIKTYCKDRLGFEGTLNQCAELIQKNFGHFVKYTRDRRPRVKTI